MSLPEVGCALMLVSTLKCLQLQQRTTERYFDIVGVEEDDATYYARRGVGREGEAAWDVEKVRRVDAVGVDKIGVGEVVREDGRLVGAGLCHVRPSDEHGECLVWSAALSHLQSMCDL